MDPRPNALVVCAHCGWRAAHTADTHLEVAAFLRTLLLAHVLERHPERADQPLRVGELAS